ncbi:MAG: GNAT family N-acetyltransferase [Nitrososphaerales archaeon]
MTTQRDRFQELLENERGFDQLFCDLATTEHLYLFHNRNFAEDPIFNHFAVQEQYYDKLGSDSFFDKKIIQEARAASFSLKLSTSIFVESFLPKRSSFEKIAVESGYRLTDKMEVLSKETTKVERAIKFEVSSTKNVLEWNSVFVQSYGIPASWGQELLRRENKMLLDPNVTFVIARDRDSKALGCTLAFVEPKSCLGIYCVGTLKEYRGRGIALDMLAFCEMYALNHNCPIITLQTLSSDNVSPLYKKIGYKTDFEREILWSP